MTELVTEQQAAALLHVSVKCLQGWRSRGGDPPFVKLGRCGCYGVPDLEAFVRSAVRTSTSDPDAPSAGRSRIRVESLLDKTGRALTRGPSAEPTPRPVKFCRVPTPRLYGAGRIGAESGIELRNQRVGRRETRRGC